MHFKAHSKQKLVANNCTLLCEQIHKQLFKIIVSKTWWHTTMEVTRNRNDFVRTCNRQAMETILTYLTLGWGRGVHPTVLTYYCRWPEHSRRKMKSKLGNLNMYSRATHQIIQIYKPRKPNNIYGIYELGPITDSSNS